MSLKNLIILLIIIFSLTLNVFAQEQVTQESEQQINDFSLAGYGEKGKKTWEILAKSADIFTDIIKLKDIVGNLYGKDEDIRLTADKGDFNKVKGNIHLEQNVVIITSKGAKLTTNSLNWDRKNEIISTKDAVNIERGDIIAKAFGATGYPNLNKFSLLEDVEVEINRESTKEKKGENPKNKIIITCDGPLEIDYEKNIAIFNNNVKVDNKDFQIYSDIMEVYFPQDKETEESKKTTTLMGAEIEKIIARGNVRIVRGENISYSDEAIYIASDEKIKLQGTPKLIIYSTEELKDASSGD